MTNMIDFSVSESSSVPQTLANYSDKKKMAVVQIMKLELL